MEHKKTQTYKHVWFLEQQKSTPKKHNRIVSSTTKAQQPDRFEHEKSTKKLTNRQTRLVFGAQEKHKKNRIASSTRKAQQPDRFEHEKSTKKTQAYKHFWFLERKESTNKNTIGSFGAQEKHNRKEVSVIEIYGMAPALRKMAQPPSPSPPPPPAPPAPNPALAPRPPQPPSGG